MLAIECKSFEEWRLVKSAGDTDFSWTQAFRLIFPEMNKRNKTDRETNEKQWVRYYLKLVDVVYTILTKKLQESKKRKEEA